jgi:mannose-6-phosphate isomerase-like protein (cupin superfamily)
VLLLAQAAVKTDPAIDLTRPATDVLASDILSVLQAASPTSVSDTPIRVVDVGRYNVGVFVVHRPKGVAGGAILHDNRVAEIYYMLEGAGTLVTGGKLLEPERLPADSRVVRQINGPSLRGSRIDSGTTRRIAKGDVVIIPGGTPHWWSAIEADITYLVVRPDPDGIIEKK